VKSVRALQLASAMVLSLGAASALAQGAIKLGMVGEFSGPFAQYGQQILGWYEGVHEGKRRHDRRQEDRDRAKGLCSANTRIGRRQASKSP